jgi:hypothetical protein
MVVGALLGWVMSSLQDDLFQVYSEILIAYGCWRTSGLGYVILAG